jgi:cytochrome c oxidase cbb3-type subunit I/II
LSSDEEKIIAPQEETDTEKRRPPRIVKRKIAQRNLFSIVAGGFAVFFLMVSMVVVAPYMFLLDVPPTTTAHQYTALEARGRSLYLSYGCFYCHSQQVRPYDWALGNVSQEGDYYYDSPHTLGTERTGPDLAQIGGMRPTIWHSLHDRDPRSVSPGSIMPNFGFLTDQEIEALTAYIQNLGQENKQVQTSITNGSAYHPVVPEPYTNASNEFLPQYFEALVDYNVDQDQYNGSEVVGDQWATIFDVGKANYTQRCLGCHGSSGNSQGPYARHVVTQPANLNERIASFPSDAYHIWRVSEGVPGTAMPAWALSLNETDIKMIAVYELSFVFGSARTVSGDISDAEGDNFANAVLNSPLIDGTAQDFQKGKNTFTLYCAQCHGDSGQGEGPASSKTLGGYISPVPANFTESGGDFLLYGRYVWKVREGVETTNMSPWKWVMNNNEIYQVIFYIQGFSTANDYNAKWGPQYMDSFARNLKANSTTSSAISRSLSVTSLTLTCVFFGLVLWTLHHELLLKRLETSKLRRITNLFVAWRRLKWT